MVTPVALNRRTRGATTTVEGLFAVLWFSWGSAQAPHWLRVGVWVGTAASILAIIAGAVLRVTGQDEHSEMSVPSIRRRYNRIVAAEFGVLALGAAILAAAGLSAWIAVWVCAGVGVHMLPLARVFHDLLLVPLGTAILVVAGAALVTGLATSLRPSTVTGPATGLCLLVAALATLTRQRAR